MNMRNLQISYENASLINYDRELERRDREEVKERAIELLFEAIEYIRGNQFIPSGRDEEVARILNHTLKNVL